MYKKFLKFMLALILKALKPKKMNISKFEKIFEMYVIPNMGNIHKVVRFDMDTSGIDKVFYDMTFKDKTNLRVGVEYKNNSLNLYFESTTIIHLDVLKVLLNNIDSAFKIASHHYINAFQIELTKNSK